MKRFSIDSIEKAVQTKSEEVQKRWSQPAEPPRLLGTAMLQMLNRVRIIVDDLHLCRNKNSLIANVTLIITDIHEEFGGMPADKEIYETALRKYTRKWAKQGGKRKFCHGTELGLVCYCDEAIPGSSVKSFI